MPRIDLIKLRRGTEAEWFSANPTLANGEYGFETDTRRSKIGDGTTAWNDLDYLSVPVTGTLPPIENIYTDITELLANQGSQTEGFLQKVTDASGDDDVNSGRAYYLKTDASTASLDDYIRQTDDIANALDAGQGKQTADCGTVIPLDTVYGHNCNMQSANSNTSYTVNNENLINSYARVKINASSEPTVSGATQQGGIGFVPNTDMILLVQNLGDAGLVYSFNSVAINTGEADTLQTVTDRGGLTDQNMQILSDAPSFVVSETTTFENSYVQIAADTNTGFLDIGNSDGHVARFRPLNMGKSVDITFAGEDGDLTMYSGTWSASTNTPTLANTDTGVKAVEYKVSVAGTVDFGAGNITFAVGDIVANDGSIWYKKVDNNQSGGSVTLPWINIEDYGAVADALGDSGVDSTSAWNDALDALETAGGGVLYIPYTDGKRFNITPETATTRDYSNIVITSFTQGRIFVKDTTSPSASTSRGVLVNIGTGTNNFKISNLDVLVSSGALRNDFENGVICSQVGNIGKVVVDNMTIKNETKLDSAVGVDGITFFRDVADGLDTDTIQNLTIRNCDIELYGNSIYGIQLLRKITNVKILHNTFLLHANTDQANDAYNAIAVYGDSEDFLVDGNVIYGSGHSGIAVSMSKKGQVVNNKVYNVMYGQTNNEAGIEVEYKSTHGDDTLTSNQVIVANNYVEHCQHGIAVFERDDSATTIAPFEVIITDNIVYDSSVNDIIVASKTAGSTDYTSTIKNVTVKGNMLNSTASRAGISVYDAMDFKILNNTIKGGQNRGIILGRDSNIYTTGFGDVIGNDIHDTVLDGIFLESNSATLRISDNNVYNAGTYGFRQLTNQGGDNFQITNNYAYGAGNDGFYFLVGRTTLLGSVVSGNRAKDCTGRGFLFRFDDSVLTDNVSKNCPTADNLETTGGVKANNLDL